MKTRNQVFITSFILTVVVFLIGIFLSYTLDHFRINSISDIIAEYEIGKEAYFLEQNFVDSLGGDSCPIIERRVTRLKAEIREVGQELSKYSKYTIFRKPDFEYLKRKYMLLQLRFLAVIENSNRLCTKHYIPIVYFFNQKDDLGSERQSYILTEISQEFDKDVVAIVLDFDYDKEPLIQALAGKLNVSKSPSIVIDNKIKFERIVYTGEIRAIIRERIASRDIDPFFMAPNHDSHTSFETQSVNPKKTIDYLKHALSQNTTTDFAKGDILLVLGRLMNNNSVKCQALPYYESALNTTLLNTTNLELQAVLHETIASLGCGASRKDNLLQAANIWSSLGVQFRADIITEIAYGNIPKIVFEEVDIRSGSPEGMEDIENAASLTIGESNVQIAKNDVIVAQTDRVVRDWLGGQLSASPEEGTLLTTFSERLEYTPEQLREDIGWHEGARLKQILEYSRADYKIATGTIVKQIQNKWYAPNDRGVFMFEVPIDKIRYPTTRFLRSDIAVIVDTHGVNMLVEQAIRNNASVVIGCCDHPGKIVAAQYLSDHGITSLCFTDKYAPLAMYSGAAILGSPPIKKQADSAVIGAQPISINLSETIIVADASENAPSYYDTPARYIEMLSKYHDIKTVRIPISKNEASKITEAADLFNASVIATRTFTKEEYETYSEWLQKDSKHRIILLHSASYPYGFLLFQEFPSQTTFDDINPIPINNIPK